MTLSHLGRSSGTADFSLYTAIYQKPHKLSVLRVTLITFKILFRVIDVTSHSFEFVTRVISQKRCM